MRQLLLFASRETSGLAMQLADLFVHDVDVSDPGARDPEFIREIALPFFDALRIHYFRAEIDGADNVPRDRPFIAVANHNGGPLPPDRWGPGSYRSAAPGGEASPYRV